ncbi:unnamed protein product [Triticum turgidum subsp. durum]|uniref:Uncharacterized protein n=1 Tax=Triticum turgidum subsp. durum TaxID=4567 RepID=A0A9R1NVN2_TRITD|nr:unnamed protein product [Triticum turgidum subsp. durum]
MASLRILSVIAVVAIFALAGTAVANDLPDYIVQGRVYCDTCRAGFETNVTEYIKGAKVRLECKRFGTEKVERSIDGVTDETGTYKIELKDSHPEDICEMIVLSRNVGISDNIRMANPLGYLKDKPLPVCPDLLKTFNPTTDDDH